MALSPHAKTPRLNALLIGKRTVPSGCRVLNVSQQGMSLQCDPDGRLLTFSNGDSVDIYLSVEHANGQNKFTIPAIISHVDENTIDVVFHCTDTELAGLIESYRTSESHNIEASINYRRVNRSQNTLKPVAANDQLDYSEQPDRTARQNSRTFYGGLLILFISSMVLLGAYYYISSINKRMTSLETVSRSHTNELAEVQTQVFSSRLQDGRYASLNARMKALTDAFQSFEKRVTQTMPREPLVVAATAPAQFSKPATTTQGLQKKGITPPVAQKPTINTTRPKAKPGKTPAPSPAPVRKEPAVIADKQSLKESSTPSMQKHPVILPGTTEQAATAPPKTAPAPRATRPDNPVATGTKFKSATRPQPAAPRIAASAAPPKITPARTEQTAPAHSGPWIINLLSSPDKAYVDKAMSEAQSRGFAVVTTSAKVKGRQYWRLQIPGFESMASAKKAAEPVREQMNIKDVWIFKR